MTQTQHTPGPWTEPRTYQNIDGKISMIAIYGDHGKKTVYRMTGGELSAGVVEATLANARLIAAAPDLLAAHKAIAGMNVNNGTDHAQLSALFITISRAAIRAATE